jgi:hypothetical protein
MDDLFNNGRQDAFDNFSPSIQPEFPAGIGDGTVVWEDFDELNDPDPDPDDDCWMSVDQHNEPLVKDESFPKATDWKDDPPEEQYDVVVTVDKAR